MTGCWTTWQIPFYEPVGYPPVNSTMNLPMNSTVNPRLRELDVRPLVHQGQPALLLRDPQQISLHQLVVTQPLGAVLAFCDGRHDLAGMVAAFRHHHRIALPPDAVEDLLSALDENYMLDNERAARRRLAALEEFRAAPARPAHLAGAGYPADPRALWRLLQDYLETADAVAPRSIDWTRPVGLLSPHIDYPRGCAVYAQVWKRAAYAVREAELVVLLGTDHYGSDPFTLTRQSYATPYGVLPTDTTIVDRLAQLLGEDAAFAGELRHRGEHSLELVAVWLHHMRAGAPVPVVPILVGSFYPFIASAASPADAAPVAAVLEELRHLAEGRRVLVVASGDLAHVGPAFGGQPVDAQARARLHAADTELVAAMQAGAAQEFIAAISRVQDRNNVCGVAPIYLTMKLLDGSGGEQLGYAVCPADDHNTSVVTVTGMFFA
jgi:hypothetical protein